MTAPSHNLHIELAKKLRSHFKSQDLPHRSDAFILGIPIARDVGRLLLRQHRIENRLLRQSWRKLAKLTGANQIQLSLTLRPAPCCQWYVQRLRITSRPQCSNRLSGTLPRAETLTFLRWRWSLELSCTVLRTTQMRVSNPTACHAPHAVFPRSTL